MKLAAGHSVSNIFIIVVVIYPHRLVARVFMRRQGNDGDSAS